MADPSQSTNHVPNSQKPMITTVRMDSNGRIHHDEPESQHQQLSEERSFRPHMVAAKSKSWKQSVEYLE